MMHSASFDPAKNCSESSIERSMILRFPHRAMMSVIAVHFVFVVNQIESKFETDKSKHVLCQAFLKMMIIIIIIKQSSS